MSSPCLPNHACELVVLTQGTVYNECQRREVFLFFFFMRRRRCFCGKGIHFMTWKLADPTFDLRNSFFFFFFFYRYSKVLTYRINFVMILLIVFLFFIIWLKHQFGVYNSNHFIQ